MQIGNIDDYFSVLFITFQLYIYCMSKNLMPCTRVSTYEMHFICLAETKSICYIFILLCISLFSRTTD